jgi:iron(III) transport system ATP-binding protein
MIRPTGVQLVGTHLDEHHLAGTVADVAYRGRGYEYAIDLPGHGRLTGVFAPVRASRGESVGLRLDPEHCHVFAAADEPLAAPAEDPPAAEPATAPSVPFTAL